MDRNEWLAERFEASRARLKAVAYRMLGSLSEADDAVQEGWLRLSRADTNGVENLEGWLTTAVARVCLDMLRSRKSRREELLGAHPADPIVAHEDASDPEQEVLLAESVGLALLVVLERLAPAERVAFVLHDVFAVPFEDIAPVVRRSDRAAAPSDAVRELRGAVRVAEEALRHSDLARFARPVLANGSARIVVAPRGRLRVVICCAVRGGKIAEMDVIADPARLRKLDLGFLHD